MLTDRRWTVGPEMQAIFRWENGDDLSIVKELSRRYIPRKAHPPFVCTCLLCRDKKSGQPCEPEETESNTTDETTVDDHKDNDDDRSIHLYCRLFYRKGPWFRLDDVFTRYYAPKQKTAPVAEEASVSKRSKENRPPPKHSFFQPSHAATQQQSKATMRCASVDDGLVEKYLESLLQLLSDVERLVSRGFVRSFASEEECGKTVGVSLITCDERGTILTLLGRGKKQVVGQSTAHNEIWKQMTSQRSIFQSRSVLPVRQHVDDLVLEKLCKNIVLACSRVSHLPAALVREKTLELKTRLLAFKRTLGLVTCFRLREEPTLTLQRCARLYLCATSGPGDMRADGSNGWRSLMDIDSSDAPLSKLVRPPGVQSFHQATFPGLSHRFGLQPAGMMEAYRDFPVEGTEESTDLVFHQVFPDRPSFLCWEACVELRANVDYLLELNEMVRYNDRRHKKGKSELGGGNGESFSADAVDFLGVLTETGRLVLFDIFTHVLGDTEKYRVLVAVEKDVQLLTSGLENDCELILVVLASFLVHVLSRRNETVKTSDLVVMRQRPWLRHMWWDGCVAYILWDLVPILERKELYALAVDSLEVLLFGKRQCWSGNHCEMVVGIDDHTALAPLLLSRRARGKAFDRLVIDKNHLFAAGQQNRGTKGKELKSQHQSHVREFCLAAIVHSMSSSFISFSSIRTLAKRMKRPLSQTLENRYVLEAAELGLRFDDDDNLSTVDGLKYRDWTPTTDYAVANAIPCDESGVGSRCAFIGHEDRSPFSSETLNVEQLALEFYNSGRLPAADKNETVKGGWIGWHDEGGHLRALFRILCAAPLLGMDWGCGSIGQTAALYLSPYQAAPFDLHVGFDLGICGHVMDSVNHGFYCRRRESIESFLGKISSFSPQEIADLVHSSVSAHLRFMVSRGRRDPVLERDLQRVRTLSLVAAGCGGRQLAAAFRCLCFDYRHYSGGLPDLLMVRASSNGKLVELGDWIGEEFAAERLEAQEAKRVSLMLSDEEFLGCNKVGDSGSKSNRSNQKRVTAETGRAKLFSLDDLPAKLELVHNNDQVHVECMFVEVKSSNDRLDPRQEDWLNVLDRYGWKGSVRVCKFQSNTKKAQSRNGSRSETDDSDKH